jgi:hypothetical protein
VEGDGGAGSWGGLTEGNIGNGAGADEDTDAHVLAAAEAENSHNDVASPEDLENIFCSKPKTLLEPRVIFLQYFHGH